jgi:drug/metabolite transporter (DMT)-like permease
MTERGGRPIAAAMAGASCIASSAVVMRLAGSSPSVTALGRCGFALPVLAVLAWLERRRTGSVMTKRSRWLARLGGVFLAGDLILWSHAIDEIGAGLGTVVSNLQVLIVAMMAWWLLGERPKRSLLMASPVMLAGLALVGGLFESHAYGAHPGLGVAFGIAVAVLYSCYILLLRQATSASSGGAKLAVAPLFEATLGGTFGAAVLGFVLHDYRLGPALPALGWLVLLALTSQVIGWLLITTSMSRLPAWLVSVLLLIQPAGSVTLSAIVLGERPSPLQLTGVALMLAGVIIAAAGHTRAPAARPAALAGRPASQRAPGPVRAQ